VKGYVVVDESLCKGCALCTTVCPKHLLRIAEERFTDRGYRPVELLDPTGACTGCVLCATICPEAAVSVYRAQAAA
jgi:2-oxoglutarate ferredoxin oxidoreductase subunit delta